MSDSAFACPKCGAPNKPLETKGRSSARKVKAISFLIFLGSFLAMATDAQGIALLMFFGGFFGFVVGRFME